MNAVTPAAELSGIEPLRAAFARGRPTDLEGRLYATATSTLLVFER